MISRMSVATLVQPSGEMWKKIRVELNEDVATRDQSVAIIKSWLKQQPHLPDEFDDARLMTFLRGCSFSLEKCKRKLDMYFTMRTACPEFFTNRDITSPELANLCKRGQGSPLPGLTPNGRRVTICRGIDKRLEPQHLTDAYKFAMMVGDVRLKEEVEGVAGDIYILDASILAPSHLGKVSITGLRKFLTCIQEAYPVKLKEVHVVNASSFIEAFVNLCKPFLTDKIKNRIFIHTELSTLYPYVPREMLPEEYGGDAGSIADIHNAWVEKLKEYKDWFTAQESVKANEALRPGKPTNYDELFGVEGTFRQLSID